MLFYFEGVFGSKELMGEGSDGPSVNLFVVAFSDQHFGGQINGGATECGPEFFGAVH